MGSESLIIRQDGWLTSWVGPELVMMSGEAGRYISLSETAGRVWEMLESPRTLDTLCAALAEEYAMDDATIRAQVIGFLSQMQAEGMVIGTAAGDNAAGDKAGDDKAGDDKAGDDKAGDDNAARVD